jgi:hypothetical protein
MTFELFAALGPMLVVPLTLRLFPAELVVPRLRWWVIAAALAAAGLFLSQGLLAAAFTLPWLGSCSYLALRSLLPFRGPISIACAYLTVGAGWLLLAAGGSDPLDLGDEIVILTAIHFHFAGFGALVIATTTSRSVRRHRRAAAVAVAGIAVAMPVLAAGFTLSSTAFQLVGASLLASSICVSALVGLRFVTEEPRSRAVVVPLAISASAILIGMVLALHFSLAPYMPWAQMSWSDMARIHGSANATFVLLGSFAWAGLSRQERSEPDADR